MTISVWRASPKGDDLSEWVATISGPEDSVYAGGTFFMDVTFPDHYPYTAPRVSLCFDGSQMFSV